MAYSVAQAQSWSQLHAADSAQVASGAIPAASLGLSGVMCLVVPAQGAGANVDFTALPYKIRVTDAWCVNTSGAAGVHTTTVFNRTAGADVAITDAMDTDKADTTVTRAASINDAANAHTINAGETIRVTVSAASDGLLVYLAYMRMA